MMSNLYLDPETNDIVLDDNFNLRITTTDAEELSQLITTRLQTYSGEAFSNRAIGIPYFEQVLIKNPNLPLIRSIIAAEVASIPGVRDVLRVDLTLDKLNRKLNGTIEVRSTAGEVVETFINR